MPKSLNVNAMRTPRKEVELFVASRIYSLQRGYLSERGKANASKDLAILRRVASRQPGATSESYALECEGLSTSLTGRGGEPPTRGEWAIHAALTLYAIHQQSMGKEMFKQGVSYGIGQGVRRLEIQKQQDNGEQGPIVMPSRFAALATANSIEEALHYARQLVKLLKTKEISLDHARFAGQLFDFQDMRHRDRVRLEWGREFARKISQEGEEK